ncbi:MAG: hypothetical protein PWP04_1405 [Candidatus Atribacteria bacterium]|nr:hypothetical protein [Candidatus Atribacteria bacterium]
MKTWTTCVMRCPTEPIWLYTFSTETKEKTKEIIMSPTKVRYLRRVLCTTSLLLGGKICLDLWGDTTLESEESK